jgi:hypothetical protein
MKEEKVTFGCKVCRIEMKGPIMYPAWDIFLELELGENILVCIFCDCMQ